MNLIILQELSREYDIGTGVQSAHIQMGFKRENFSFALNESSWTVSRLSLTLEYAMLYTCDADANEPCQTLASFLSVVQIIYKLGNSTTDAREMFFSCKHLHDCFSHVPKCCGEIFIIPNQVEKI